MTTLFSPILFSNLGNTTVKRQMLQVVNNITPSITQEDIDRGTKLRYFARYKTQKDGIIYELNGGQYESIENNSLFSKTTINWIIRGKLEDTVLTLGDGTSILVKGVISQNQALLDIAVNDISNIKDHLQNHMEFWVGE